MSTGSQRVLIWWSMAFLAIYTIALAFLLDMVPPPRATLSAAQVSDWYAHRHTRILAGAAVASWTSAFFVPMTAVITVQLARVEGGRRVWTITACASGVMSSLFLVLPPVFWGVAAFTPSRSADVTAVMHELGMLTFLAVVPYFIFMWIAVAVFCLRPPTMPHSPFPRWFGYFTLAVVVLFEAGPIGFLARTGPFAWNGVLVFWIPLTLVIGWITLMAFLLLRAIRQQGDETEPAFDDARALRRA